MNPLLRNSDFVTTGTSRPRNAVWRCTSKGSGGRVPVRGPAQHVQHLALDDHAVPEHAVLRGREPGADRRQRGRGRRRDDGRDRAARPCRRSSAGSAACSCSAFQPSPSRTSRTTASASRTGRRQPDGVAAAERARARCLRPTRRRAREAPVRSQVPPVARIVREHGEVKVSTRGDYAARALLSLALHGSERPTSVKEIAERTTPAAALSRADPARGEGRRARALEARRRRRLRARAPGRPRSRSPTSSPRSKGPQLPLAEHPDHCEGHCILQEVWVCVSDETRRYLEQVTLAELVERTHGRSPRRRRPLTLVRGSTAPRASRAPRSARRAAARRTCIDARR